MHVIFRVCVRQEEMGAKAQRVHSETFEIQRGSPMAKLELPYYSGLR